ncbi:MAG: glycosyltransferase family 39 protein [Candidatus Omnitrophica bacterium]|nr:glycosyltransferase family 39 protein [Candidatus Omnitrophota bacterium]
MKKVALPALILLLGAALRFYGLGGRGLYFPDETRYYKYALEGRDVLRGEGPRSAMAFAGDTFTAKPGHTALGILWMDLFGESPYSALTMGAFFGALTLLVVYFITRAFYTGGAAAIATLVLAVSSLHAYYSRSFMCHTDHVFFIVLAFYAYALPLALKRHSAALHFTAGLLTGMAFAIHPTTIIYIAVFFISDLLLLGLDRSRRLAAKIIDSLFLYAAIAIVPLIFLFLNSNYFSRLTWLMNEASLVVAQRVSAPVPFILSRVVYVFEGGGFAASALLASCYFVYRTVRHKRPVDALILLQSFCVFFYWEFLAGHERFSRQVIATIPFFAVAIGVFIDGINFKTPRITTIVKGTFIAAIVVTGVCSATAMLAGTRNEYGRLEEFINRKRGPVRIATTSEYIMGTQETLMPNLRTKIVWFNERDELRAAVAGGKLDLVILHPSDWLARPGLRFETRPEFTIREPQSAYLAEFYEGACFTNRLDFLKYRDNPMSYSIAVYDISDSLKKELGVNTEANQ